MYSSLHANEADISPRLYLSAAAVVPVLARGYAQPPYSCYLHLHFRLVVLHSALVTAAENLTCGNDCFADDDDVANAIVNVFRNGSWHQPLLEVQLRVLEPI